MNSDAEVQREIRGVLLRDLKQTAEAFQKLKGGRNSQVYRVDCVDGSVFAVKAYFQSSHDPRDRIGTEFHALQYLQSEGIKEAPAPISMDETGRIAVYEFIEGRPLPAGVPVDSEIDQAVRFLRKLKALASSGKCPPFPPASEACFSIQDIFRNIERRFDRLDRAGAGEPALANFLNTEVAPFRKSASEGCLEFCRKHGLDPNAEITPAERTLSPSDFGFHNALRRADGSLVFLDLEYFGWDDPAKTVVDFLLHPGMRLPLEARQRFHAGMISAFSSVPALKDRVRAVYPLFGLKWCAILLNEFTLEHSARRCFAGGASDAWSQTEQLEKARRMLSEVMRDYRDFPYEA